MDMMDYAVAFVFLGAMLYYTITEFYLPYKTKDLSLEESESLIPRYVKLQEMRKKRG